MAESKPFLQAHHSKLCLPSYWPFLKTLKRCLCSLLPPEVLLQDVISPYKLSWIWRDLLLCQSPHWAMHTCTHNKTWFSSRRLNDIIPWSLKELWGVWLLYWTMLLTSFFVANLLLSFSRCQCYRGLSHFSALSHLVMILLLFILSFANQGSVAGIIYCIVSVVLFVRWLACKALILADWSL